MSDDKIYDAENPTSGLFQAQAAIEDILTPPEDKVEDSENRVDESEEEVIEGEAELEAEYEDPDEEFDSDDDDADLDDDEYESEERQAAEAYTVKVNGEEVSVELDELKNGYSRQADYTKKSQALAEEKKTFEQARDAIVLERQQYAQLLGALQQQLNVNNEPAPDFERMYDEDPIEATRQERQWRQRQGAKQQKLQAIRVEQQRVSQANQQRQQQQMHELITAEVERLPEVIPEWKDQERAGQEREQLREYLLENGVAEDEMQALVRANHIKVLRKAMLYDQGQTKVKKATKKASRSKTVKPGGRQGQVAPRSRKLKKARQRLKDTGRLDDAAGLLESML
jgi:hypothetical protein